MKIQSDGTLLCECGNTPDSDGFDPCHADGLIDDSLLDAGSTRPLRYLCGRCGHISEVIIP